MATTLGEVAQITIGRTPPRDQARYWTKDLTRPFCTIADMKAAFIDPLREGVTEAAEAEGKAKRVPAGSLLMSFKLTIGKVGFAKRDLFPNEAIAWLQPMRHDLSAEFLALFLSGQDLSAGSGRAVKGNTLNGTSLRAIPVRLPPVEEQQRIVDLFGAVDKQIEMLTEEAAALKAMRGSLLGSLLSGEVEIPESYDFDVEGV